MAVIQRYLTAVFAASLLSCFAAPAAKAQNPVPPPAVFRLLCANRGVEINDLYYDFNGQRVSVSASNYRLSRPYPLPKTRLVSFYRERPPVPPETKPVRIPVAEARFDESDVSIVLLQMDTSSSTAGQPGVVPLVLGHSWTAYPISTLRIINLCKSPVALQIDQQVMELAPGENKSLPYPPHDPEKPYLRLEMALQLNGQWVRCFSGTKEMIYDNTRTVWILQDRPISYEHPDPGILLADLIDYAPPVAK
jgi:hypothetical protein